MKRLPEYGYTILEVLIFLMITGFMFATAVVAISGTQENAQYSQAVRDFEIQVKDTINDVAHGYYPTGTRGRCVVTAGGDVDFDVNTPVEASQNSECINIGKILMFNLSNINDGFGLGTIVGKNPVFNEPLDLGVGDLRPILAYKEDPGGLGTPVDLTVRKPLRYGVQVTKIGSDSVPAEEFSSLSFISGFSNTAQNAETRASGTLTTSVYGVKGALTTSDTLLDYNAEIESLDSSGNYEVNPADGFYLCLLTADDRRARIVIGVDGVATATRAEFDIDSVADGGVCP